MWAALHSLLFDARAPGPRAGWHLSQPGCRARWKSRGRRSQERDPHCCMKAQGDCPCLHAWGCNVQSKAGLGWTWAGCGSQRMAACPPSVSLGPHLSPLQPPPWGSHRPMAGPGEGLCGGLATQPATVHRGPDACTLDHGLPPWTWLCLSSRVPCHTLKVTVNTEEGLTLRVTCLLVCVCLVLGFQDQKAMTGLHKCSA